MIIFSFSRLISEIVGWKVHSWAIDHWIHHKRLSLKPFHRAKSIHRASAYRRQQIASMASVSLAFCRPNFIDIIATQYYNNTMNTYTIYCVDDYCLIASLITEYINTVFNLNLYGLIFEQRKNANTKFIFFFLLCKFWTNQSVLLFSACVV